MRPFVTPRSINEQIDWLNDRVKVYIAPSKIHGIGVFALKDLKKEERLYLIPENPERTWFTVPYSRFKDLNSAVREIVLARWPSVINGSAFLAPNDDVWMSSFINHSDGFNYVQDLDVVIEDVNKDEEITEDYRVMHNHEKIYSWLKLN